MRLLVLQGKTYCLHTQNSVQTIFEQKGLPIDLFFFTVNGRPFTSQFEQLPQSAILRASLTLEGGKGGYGAKLKTQGGKKVRPNDNMFSRNMSGERIVNVTIQREYKEFIAKKIEEKKEVAKQRERVKVLENTMKEGQSFMKVDKAYKRQVEEAQNTIANSIIKGKMKLAERNREKEAERGMVRVEEEQKEEVKEEKNHELQDKQEQSIQKGAQVVPEQAKEQEKYPKRPSPCERQPQQEGESTKKVKMGTEVQQAKPVFMSAEERFKALFKKK